MAKNSTPSTTVPDTVWLGRGRHPGPEPELDIRRNLIALKAAGVLDDFVELEPSEAARSTVLHPRDASVDPGPSARRLFEARWRPVEGITVRAQLTTFDPPPARRKESDGVLWVLAAEAEHAWDARWASPATMFWPDSDRVAWDQDTLAGLRVRTTNHLPKDDDAVRRLLRDCTRQSWYIHLVVHEAMTPDAVGQRPLAAFLPPSLRHRVIEHRATPDQARIADFAMKRELDVRMPRGGAVILPTSQQGSGYDAARYTVQSVFLDGTQPTELLDRIREFDTLPRPLPAEAEQALNRLRRGWHLLTDAEELAHAQGMVTRYAEALEDMTRSRDRYREAAETAHAALAEATRGNGVVPEPPASGTPGAADGAPRSALTKAFGRFRGPNNK
ncbi:hypothetical protein DSC45_04960 [Streptomyces sp. YIM 130001]|uniref:hypothetical protein n=1 Tax=Streptomyces sp. YIM 130001 TaxID=2259644 RepID=UPI000E64F135|nr:hypothetical protein [Streptomyces sp. YIM 130001]RII20557.1 hypothetical protein DSC45_04960 [Streptomyces sp. YIM 130001]